MGGKKNRPKTKWRKVSIGNECDKSEDQSTEEPEQEPLDQAPHLQNGGGDPRNYEQTGEEHFLTNGEEFEQLPIFHQTPAGLIHIPQNGFFPFPLVVSPPMEGAPPSPLPVTEPAPEGSVGGCYVNGLWIPNSELFKYGIHPPPNALSSTLVYHPNVPWVRLRPVPGPPPGGHHHHHLHHHPTHHHHHQLNPEEDGDSDQTLAPNGHIPVPTPPPPPPPPMQLPMPSTIPPNAQYLLYFTRKPPPWYQTHPRDRDHNWRRRTHHNPSPYWSFNHASVHRNHHAQQLPDSGGVAWNGAAVDEFGALSRHNETGLPAQNPQQTEDQTIAPQHAQLPVVPVPPPCSFEGTPYIYPGYSFGQPVFTAPVFPLSKSVSGGSSRESPSTRSDEVESSSGVPQESSSSPASSSSRPSLSSVGGTTTAEEVKEERKEAKVEKNHSVKSASAPASAPVKDKKETVVASEAAATIVKEADKRLTSSKVAAPLNLLPASPVAKASASASSPESNQSQRSKKKKKRKKNKSSSSDMEKQAGHVNGLPATEPNAPTKPDSLDLKRKESPKAPATVKLSNGSLPNFKIDLAGPSRESSLDDEEMSPNRCPNAVILSKPFLEFAENLLRGTLEMARKEIAELHGRPSMAQATPAEAQSPVRQEEANSASQSLEDEPTKDVQTALMERDAPASTLASTLGINTSPDEHGTDWQAGGTHSNLEKNLRGTFAEKLAERVISDSRTECRQTGHRPESLPLPVATPIFEGAAHPAADSPNVEEERKKTTATVEDSPTAALRVERSFIDWNGVDADTRNSSSQLSSLNRPDSRSAKSDPFVGHDSALVDSCSDGIGRSDQFLNHHNPTIVSRDERETGALILGESAPDQSRNYSPPPSVDSSHKLNSVDEYSSRNRALEEFADRVLYEIAVSIRDEFLTKGDLVKREEDEDSTTGDAASLHRESEGHAEKWSPETDVVDVTRRESREFESLGSELGIREANSAYQRRYSSGSYEGGEKYVDETTANYLAHLLPSDTLIRETEQELKSLQSRVLSTNHSIYKLAYDEVITDQSETDGDEASPFSSLTSAPEQHPREDAVYQKGGEPFENPLSMKDFLPQRFEIMVHEADSMSEAGSEDVELIPRYDSGTTGDKHIYVNRLSLATELLRTQEELPYDDEFKPVTAEPTRTSFPTDVVNKKSESPTKKTTQSGRANSGFVRDEMMPLSVITSGPRMSTMSTADSGVQSEEESGDEVAEEATEGQKGQNKDNLTSLEDQGQQGKSNRRMGTKTARLGTMSGGGPWDPCLCCCVM